MAVTTRAFRNLRRRPDAFQGLLASGDGRSSVTSSTRSAQRSRARASAASWASGSSSRSVSVRTVEANLTRVYAKLGIRSRTELASRRGR
jgi:hypothetical protein